jgi:hypothetical protein
MKAFIRRFSKIPINDDVNASLASEGTFATVARGPFPC